MQRKTLTPDKAGRTSLDAMLQAVAINQGRAKLEASGGITLDNIQSIAETGVDYISVGGITKDIQAVDLSMRINANA